ncbi:hypothetical protein SODALDRAFT_331032 [Sodiomyces alkalinus F11]|uniref:Uncharacterized protein n=1 Tax=Sodiomyces alkalinus (strain CBS 110278 / VKM F-3762 / F11) TaxID=1314773 RepID=A0A3N2Q3G7_SODAK|nr:hypothetical protein SODALDRAFT_331032 [Sodiomyces alkalinus F11]ROT41309.1 hypothetical protein SODALDRAFT_331032 [Sodiomyces alkalinus F11]
MRLLPSSSLVLALSAQAIAHPFLPGLLRARDGNHDGTKTTATTTRAGYSVVPIDGGCSGPDCDAPTVTVTRSTASTSLPSSIDISFTSVITTRTRIPVVPIDGAPTTVIVYDPTLSHSSTSSSSSSSDIASSTSTNPPIISQPPSPSSSEAVSSLSSAVSSESSILPSLLDPTPSASAAPDDPPDTDPTGPISSTSEPPASSSSVEHEPTISVSTSVEWGSEPPLPTSMSSEFSSRPSSFASSFVWSEVSPTVSSDPSSSPIPTSFTDFPTTLITSVSSITDFSSAQPSLSSQSFDNGLWHSSKYPSWNGTNNRYFK